MRTIVNAVLVLVLSVGWRSTAASAQILLSHSHLDELVSRITLYPDPLMAQVLTAATYSDQIPEAAEWADQHRYLSGDRLAAAISEDKLSWEPSVLALLPFPSVLDTMADNVRWTRQLGDAVLAQRADVMDAVQRMRQKARNYGYLQDCPQYRVVVAAPGIVEILPVDPFLFYVPIYDPLIVFSRPRLGIGIRFAPVVPLGAGFARWGWSRPAISWSSHAILLDGRPWARNIENRQNYVHPYEFPRGQMGPREEHHELRPGRPVGGAVHTSRRL